MTISKETYVIDAHHPREIDLSTVSPDDRLKIVYSIYKDDRFDHPTVDPVSLVNLVFVHGTQMGKEIWQYMIELCFNEFGGQLGRVVAIDSVNHGESAIINKGKLGSVATWADGGRDIACVVRSLNNAGPTILIGHSMGGSQCIYTSIFEPGLIDSIIVFDPVLYMDPELVDHPKAIELVGIRFKKLTRFVKTEFKNNQDYLNYMTKIGISRTFHPRIQKDYIDNSAIYNPDGTVSFKTTLDQTMISYASSQLALRDLIKMIPSIRCEVLYVCGDIHDWNAPESGERILAALRYGTGKIVPDGKHLLPFDKPNETFAAIKDFISKRRLRGSALIKEALARREYDHSQRDQFVKIDYQQQLDLLEKGQRRSFSKL